MVEGADLVAHLLRHIEDEGHLVGAVAVVVDEDFAVQHALQRFLGEVALLAVIGLGIEPGLPVDREIAHARRGHPAATAIDALRVLAAGHLEAVRRIGELHPLHRARGHVLERGGTPAHQIGRAGQDLQRGHAAIGERAGKAGVLRPDRMFGPDFGRGRAGRLVTVRMRLDRRGGIVAEVRVDIDDARRHELAGPVEHRDVGRDRRVRAADRDDLAAAEEDRAIVDPAALAVVYRRIDERGRRARIGRVGRREGRFRLCRGAAGALGVGLPGGRTGGERDGQRACGDGLDRFPHVPLMPRSGDVAKKKGADRSAPFRLSLA